jgi:hypothetical protein
MIFLYIFSYIPLIIKIPMEWDAWPVTPSAFHDAGGGPYTAVLEEVYQHSMDG